MNAVALIIEQKVSLDVQLTGTVVSNLSGCAQKGGGRGVGVGGGSYPQFISLCTTRPHCSTRHSVTDKCGVPPTAGDLSVTVSAAYGPPLSAVRSRALKCPLCVYYLQPRMQLCEAAVATAAAAAGGGVN